MKKNYNKDIMEWVEFPAYDLLWCDPPWEQRMVKMFQTIMRKDVGRTVDHTISELLEKLGTLADPSKPLIVEYSIKGRELVESILTSLGHTHIKNYFGSQTSKRPFVIMNFNIPVIVNTTRRGLNIVTDSLIVTKYETIFDPFAGIGATAKAVRKAGKTYIGSELNPKRFKKLEIANP